MPKAKTSKKSVASASPASKRARSRGQMNLALVQDYLLEIKNALGSQKFDAVFAKLRADKSVGQTEAVEIASLLLEHRVASGTARSAALDRIVKLHTSLTTFKLKQKAVGGRSAA